jgi:hypothetical protein
MPTGRATRRRSRTPGNPAFPALEPGTTEFAAGSLAEMLGVRIDVAHRNDITRRSRALFSQHWQNVSMMPITADYSINCLCPQVQRAALFIKSSVHVIMSSCNIAADMIEASCYVL